MPRVVKVVLSTSLIASWLLVGWPPLWLNPRIPPQVNIAKATDTTQSYSFASDTLNWSGTSCGAAGGTCQWQSGDGSPANGSLEVNETRKNKGGTWTWELTGITWESLGVPSGATVTDVDGSYNHRMSTCTSCNTGGGNTSGTLLIRDSGDSTTIATLESATTYTGATNWVSHNALGAQSVGATYQPSNTGIILRLSGNIQTNNVNGATAVIRNDEISLVITYDFAASVSVTITTDGTVTYGTVAGSQDTISLSDTQTAQNDGNVTENFSIRGQDTGCPWTLAASAGSDEYAHEFSTNSGSDWTALTTSYQSLASGVSTSGTVDFDLRITVPTSSSCTDSQSVDVTILAEQQ